MGGRNYRAFPRLVDFMAHQYNDEADYTLATYKPGITQPILGASTPSLGSAQRHQYWHRPWPGSFMKELY